MLLDFISATVPVNGTNEVQTCTIGGTPTGGSFILKWSNRASITIPWSATNATLLASVQAALDGIFGAGNTLAAVGTLTAGIGTILITFQGSYAALLQSFVMTAVSSLTGTTPTVAVTQTTPGVTATNRGGGPGQRLIYTGVTPPVVYENASNTAFAPNWVVRGISTNIISAATGTIAVPRLAYNTTQVTYNGGAGAYTLTAPTAITDDGKELTIVSETAQAHVITCSDGFNAKGSSGTATLAAAKGNGLSLIARNGHWWVTANINATLA